MGTTFPTSSRTGARWRRRRCSPWSRRTLYNANQLLLRRAETVFGDNVELNSRPLCLHQDRAPCTSRSDVPDTADQSPCRVGRSRNAGLRSTTNSYARERGHHHDCPATANNPAASGSFGMQLQSRHRRASPTARPTRSAFARGPSATTATTAPRPQKGNGTQSSVRVAAAERRPRRAWPTQNSHGSFSRPCRRPGYRGGNHPGDPRSTRRCCDVLLELQQEPLICRASTARRRESLLTSHGASSKTDPCTWWPS